MSSTFNPQILVEKLTKLNASQASIETLSHWCIFHMNKAREVVETWIKQFRCSPREQRMAFLYLANDILQNSRRKGADFVAEFWKVLPGALHDVIDNGDASRSNEALRLVHIWDERKVFGSRGHILKEELSGRKPQSIAKTGRQLTPNLRQSTGNLYDKIVSGYEVVYGGQLDEDAILGQCRDSVSFMEKVTKDANGNMTSDKAGFSDKFQHQHAALRRCIDQLSVVEASRARLVSHLREALQEQEFKLDQVRSQLQAAHSQSDQAANILQRLHTPSGDDQVLKEAQPPRATEGREQSSAEKSSTSTDGKSAAAAMAAKLTASTSSAEMLTFVLSSLAQERAVPPPEKKQKLDNDPPLMNNEDTNNQRHQQPPPPAMPMMPMPQYMQAAGPMPNVPYNYGNAPPAIPGYLPAYGPPQPNPHQSFAGAGNGYYIQQSAVPMAPVSRQ